jgi:hypothetical protein
MGQTTLSLGFNPAPHVRAGALQLDASRHHITVMGKLGLWRESLIRGLYRTAA